MNIMISAGHYPQAPGACWEGFCEHDEAMRWAAAIVELLGEDKAHLVPTGTLKSKLAFIRQRAPTLAVEVHFNSAPDVNGDGVPDGSGSETLYYPGSDRGKLLALYVQARLAPLFQPDRGVKEGWYQMNPAKGADFFLAQTPCPAIIVEPAFITQRELIQKKRSAGVAAIADGLLEFLKGEASVVLA